MMTADEARRKMEAKEIELEASQLAYIIDGIEQAISRFEDYATFDFAKFSPGAHQALLESGYTVRTSETDTNTIVTVSW